MPNRIILDLNIGKIKNKMGIDNQRLLAKVIASQFARLAKPYIPKSSSAGVHLANSAIVTNSGVEYNLPYAHYQYTGLVMVGRAPKHYIGKALKYSEAPIRGSRWDIKLMKKHAKEFKSAVINWINSRLGH